MMGRGLALLLALLAVLLPLPALAQGTSVTSSVDADEVEVGDTMTLSMNVQAEGETPSDPQIGSHTGFSVVDSSASPTRIVSIINGRRTDKQGLNVVWLLRADRVGTFTLGPPSVAVGGRRMAARAQRVTVVPRGKGTKRRRRGSGPFDPFDPFGGLGGPGPLDPFKGVFPGFDDDDRDPTIPRGIAADPKLSLPAPRAPIAFLHATIDRRHAVVGEQVTLNVYLYEDPRARQGQPSDVHEATATDFVKRSLLEDESHAIALGVANVGGHPWMVKLVRKNALFPLKTGRLSISPMSLTLPQARVGLRESETLAVDVTEPPIDGRPSGYQIGDVGDFSLNATVEPRKVDQGGAVGVTVELRGTGNLPAELPLPVQPGVEWLEPQTTDKLGPMQNERFGGTRTFSYVVRLHKAGALDLGEIRLPYFDPSSRSYGVARASIGIVEVAPGQTRDAGPDEVDAVLPGLPKPRPTLEGRHPQTFLTERPFVWGLVFGAPLAVAALLGGGGLLRRARERRASMSPSNAKIAKDRRSEAEAALRGDDGPAAVSAIARALEAQVLAATSVNVRGTSGEGVVRELADGGVAEENAREVVAVLRACEDARFSPEPVSIDEARRLFERADRAIARVVEDVA